MPVTTEQAVYDYAMSMVGKPYLWGGDDPMGGLDCSGLVIELLKALGAAPEQDMTAQGLFKFFQDRSDFNKQTFGSLAFYGRDVQNISHVAFCLSNRLVVEAGGGGSRITTLSEAIKYNAYVRVRPITYRKDLVFVLRPLYKIID